MLPIAKRVETGMDTIKCGNIPAGVRRMVLRRFDGIAICNA